MPLPKDAKPIRSFQSRGPSGNAFALLGSTNQIIRQFIKAGILPEGEDKAFMARAMSGDYANLLAVCREYVNWVDDEDKP